MKGRIYVLLIGFIWLVLAVNTGCKKETTEEAKISKGKDQIKLESLILKEAVIPKTPQKGLLYKTSKIYFGTAQGFPFLRVGWSFNETSTEEGLSYTWALGKSASIYLSLRQKQTKLTANVRSPFAGGQQEVTVKVDGKEIGRWKNSKQWVWEKHSIVIGRDKERPDVSVVEFVFSKYVEQTEKDKRPVALLFESITLE